MIMSREDDFDDILDSPDSVDAGQDDTSEPLLDDESVADSQVDEVEEIEIVTFTPEPEDETAAPRRPARKVAARKKKAAIKPKPAAKAKTRPKKKSAQTERKPAPKKTTAKKKPAKKVAAKKVSAKKVPAKKKTRPAAKKKKAAPKARRR